MGRFTILLEITILTVIALMLFVANSPVPGVIQP